MPASLPEFGLLCAPAAWRSVELISDLHLHRDEPQTLDALVKYLSASQADAVFILGDLFEVWVGDECLRAQGPQRFEQVAQQRLRTVCAGRPTYFMAGNRDFLLGAEGLAACALQALNDPTVLCFGDRRWLLTHGDALCLDDTDYQRFRAQVRSRAWQTAFLNLPLAQRDAQAQAIRTQSEAHKLAVGYTDLNASEVLRWLDASQCAAMVHGHTHHAADHSLDGQRQRHVLSDWNLCSQPPRAQALRLQLAPGGAPSVTRLALSGNSQSGV